MADVYVATFHPDRGEVRFVGQCVNLWAAWLICGSDHGPAGGMPLCNGCWAHETPNVWSKAVAGGVYRVTRWTGVIHEFLIAPPGLTEFPQ